MRGGSASIFLDACEAEGLIETELLEATILRVRCSKHPQALNALEATDSEFMRWFLREVGDWSCTNRLRLRMRLIGEMATVRGYKDRHWVEA